jgi:hypothetical protein
MEAPGSIPSVHYIVFHDGNAPNMVFELTPRGDIRQSDADGFPMTLPTFPEAARAAQPPPEEPRIELPHITELGAVHDRIPRRRHIPEPRLEFAGEELPPSEEFPGPVLIPLWRRIKAT